MRWPNLFIVGAPKSATTSVRSYLASHPDIFFPERSEMNFFGADLPYRKRISPERYELLYRDWTDERYGGDCSVFYLYSTTAAREISERSPNGAILVLLRNPVDAMASLHQQLLTSGEEVEPDLATALALEGERRLGRRIGELGNHPYALQYRSVTRYAPQLQRYFETFGRSRVKVLLYDDLSRDTAAAYRDVLEFLDLPFDGQTEFAIRNPSSHLRSRGLRKLANRPPTALSRSARFVLRNQRLRHAVRRKVRGSVHRVNLARAPRDEMSKVLRAQLTAECADDVAALAVLIDRDLSAWTDPAQHPLKKA